MHISLLCLVLLVCLVMTPFSFPCMYVYVVPKWGLLTTARTLSSAFVWLHRAILFSRRPPRCSFHCFSPSPSLIVIPKDISTHVVLSAVALPTDIMSVAFGLRSASLPLLVVPRVLHVAISSRFPLPADIPVLWLCIKPPRPSWCPGRVLHVSHSGRFSTFTPCRAGFTCIISACMAWLGLAWLRHSILGAVSMFVVWYSRFSVRNHVPLVF